MTRYFQTPVVEAHRWDGDFDQLLLWDPVKPRYEYDGDTLHVFIRTVSGGCWMQCDVGNWLVHEGDRGVRIYSDYMFQLSHKPVDTHDPTGHCPATGPADTEEGAR